MSCDGPREYPDFLLEMADRVGDPPGRDVGPLAQAFRRYADAADVADFCAWVRKNVGGEAARGDRRRALLEAFGRAFSGEEAGVLGHDLLMGAFSSRSPEALRLAGLGCLERWLADDDEGKWYAMLESLPEHRHHSDEFQARVAALLEEWVREAPGCEEDCPACGAGDVQRYPDGSNSSWFCSNCGKIWDEDPREERLEEDEDEDEDEEDGRPAAWVRLLEARGSSSRARALLERGRVPEFLERLLDLDRSLALGVLESLDVGFVCARENDLELLELDEMRSSCSRVLAVLRGGRRGFSIEPTATQGNYLVFAYF